MNCITQSYTVRSSSTTRDTLIPSYMAPGRFKEHLSLIREVVELVVQKYNFLKLTH